MTASAQKLIMAVPKGRILEQVMPVFEEAGLIPEAAFFKSDERRLRFATNHENLDIVRVRSFDVATFLAYGAAHLGVAGSDVVAEFSHPEIYAPVDLNIGNCRMVVACPAEQADTEDPKSWSHLRVATKYPSLTKRYFAGAAYRQNVSSLMAQWSWHRKWVCAGALSIWLKQAQPSRPMDWLNWKQSHRSAHAWS